MSVINLFEFLHFSDSEKNFDNLSACEGESEIFYNFPFGKKELKNPENNIGCGDKHTNNLFELSKISINGSKKNFCLDFFDDKIRKKL